MAQRLIMDYDGTNYQQVGRIMGTKVMKPISDGTKQRL
jgi:hypothetical protein